LKEGIEGKEELKNDALLIHAFLAGEQSESKSGEKFMAKGGTKSEPITTFGLRQTCRSSVDGSIREKFQVSKRPSTGRSEISEGGEGMGGVRREQ